MQASDLAGFPYGDFAAQYLNVHSVSGKEAMCQCCFHDSSKFTMQFNLDTGQFVCFSCHEGGGITKLGEAFGITNMKAVEPDVKFIKEKLALLHKQDRKKKNDKPFFLDESLLTRYQFPTFYWGKCKDDPRPHEDCTGKVGCNYHRWLKPKTVKAFDLGFDIMKNAATIPARDMDGRLLGVIKRYLADDVSLRYKYPKGFARNSQMHGSWLVQQSDSHRAVIVEGSIDTAKVWQAEIPCLGQYGSFITPNQVRLLRRLGLTELVLFYDNDKAGRLAVSYAKGLRVHKRKKKETWEYDPRTDLRRDFLVRTVRYERGMGSDPGSTSTKAIRNAVDSAVRLR